MHSQATHGELSNLRWDQPRDQLPLVFKKSNRKNDEYQDDWKLLQVHKKGDIESTKTMRSIISYGLKSNGPVLITILAGTHTRASTPTHPCIHTHMFVLHTSCMHGTELRTCGSSCRELVSIPPHPRIQTRASTPMCTPYLLQSLTQSLGGAGPQSRSAFVFRGLELPQVCLAPHTSLPQLT